MILLACESAQKIQTGIEIWNFDAADYSIYRLLNDGDKEVLSCGDTRTLRFKALHNDDLKTLLGFMMKECMCPQ